MSDEKEKGLVVGIDWGKGRDFSTTIVGDKWSCEPCESVDDLRKMLDDLEKMKKEKMFDTLLMHPNVASQIVSKILRPKIEIPYGEYNVVESKFVPQDKIYLVNTPKYFIPDIHYTIEDPATFEIKSNFGLIEWQSKCSVIFEMQSSFYDVPKYLCSGIIQIKNLVEIKQLINYHKQINQFYSETNDWVRCINAQLTRKKV